MDVADVFHQVFDFPPVLLRQAVSGRVGDIDHRSARFNDRFDDARQVFVVGPAGVFGVEFDVFDIFLRVFHGSYGPFDDLFGGRFELVVNMRVGHADPGMDPLMFGQRQRVGGYVDVFLYGASQRADRGIRNRLRNFAHRIEVARTRNRETCFQDIYAQFFQGAGYFYLFNRIQLATGNLFSVAQRRVENK